MSRITVINITFEHEDGSLHYGTIQHDAGWQQWGATQEVHGEAVDLIEGMAQAAAEHLPSDSDEDDQEGQS